MLPTASNPSPLPPPQSLSFPLLTLRSDHIPNATLTKHRPGWRRWEGIGKQGQQDSPALNMGGGCGHQLRFFVTWPSPAPSGAPSSCSRYPYHPPQQPPSLPPSLAASYTSSPPFLTPTLPLPYIASLHLRVCTHTTNLCVHNLYPTCSNSTRSYLYTLRTTIFCVQPIPSPAYTIATYFAKISPTFDRLQKPSWPGKGHQFSLSSAKESRFVGAKMSGPAPASSSFRTQHINTKPSAARNKLL